MGKKNSSLLNSVYVPMIGCFVAGVVVSRLMNHQDVVTGDVKEGDKWTDWNTWSNKTINNVIAVILAIIGAIMVIVALLFSDRAPPIFMVILFVGGVSMFTIGLDGENFAV